METLAIIPARGGSKRVPHKNLQICGGKPLVDWIIQAANDSSVERIILSSDNSDILNRACGKVLPLSRSPMTSTDGADTESVMREVLAHLWAIERYEPDLLILLQATSPLTTGRHIDEALEMIGNYDSVVSVVPFNRFVWTDGIPNFNPRKRPRSQEFTSYMENGAICITKFSQWEASYCRLGGQIGFYIMTPPHGHEIDHWGDFYKLDRLLRLRESHNLRLAVDLDGTLCHTEGADYDKASPLWEAIERVKRLRREGHYIIIHTARGATTKIDWRKLTERQLASWGVAYDELTFNKPTADFYIDDKALLIEEWEQW